MGRGLRNFVNYDSSGKYFNYITNTIRYDPSQKLDQNTVYDDNIVIFPRNIYKGETFSQGFKNYQPNDTYIKVNEDDKRPENTRIGLSKTKIKHNHPDKFTLFGRPNTFGGLCPQGYCYGNYTGRNYQCGCPLKGTQLIDNYNTNYFSVPMAK